MAGLRLVVMLILSCGVCYAQSATTSANITFAWDSNTESDLAGYRLYQSDTGAGGPFDECLASNIPKSSGAQVTYSTVLTVGVGQTLCFAVSAYDTAGNESGKSNVVCRTDQTCVPLSPQTQTIACPTGQTGTITQTRTSTCPGPVWGPWVTTNSTCTTTQVQTPSTCTPHTETRTVRCSSWWYTGSSTQQRTSTCQNGVEVWGTWVTTSSTCRPWWQR